MQFFHVWRFSQLLLLLLVDWLPEEVKQEQVLESFTVMINIPLELRSKLGQGLWLIAASYIELHRIRVIIRIRPLITDTHRWTNRQTDRQTDGRTLSSTLSSSFAVDKDLALKFLHVLRVLGFLTNLFSSTIRGATTFASAGKHAIRRIVIFH